MLLPLLIAAAVQATPPDAQDCAAHQFETVVSAEVDGKERRTKLRLCGKTGQSDAEFLETLQDSVAKIAASDVPGPLRSAMVKAVTDEIVKLQSALAVKTAQAAPLTSVVPAPSAIPGPKLPPLAGTTVAPSTAAPPGGNFTLKPRGPIAKPETRAEYSNAPALPAPVAAKPVTLEAARAAPRIVAPDLSFTCFDGGGTGEMPCVDYERNTVLIARARSNVAAGSRLVFRLSGDTKAEVPLGAIAKGRSAKVALPGDVCRGTNGGQLSVEVLVTPTGGGAPRMAEEIGPYTLRC